MAIAQVQAQTPSLNLSLADVVLSSNLNESVRNGNAKDVLKLIQDGAKMELAMSGMYTGFYVLHAAVSIGRPDLVEILLENGADANAKTSIGRTALHVACSTKRKAGCKDIIQKLLLHGADLNAQNNVNDDAKYAIGYDANGPVYMDVLDGDTPLHVAVSNGRPDLVEMLLENGADVKAKNNVGDSALHFACMRNRKTGRKDIICQLLLHGADVNAQNNVNELEDLEEDSDGELVNDDQNVGGDTPLQNAINELSIQTIRTLLNNGADISIQDGYGLNAIHWAVMIEGVETIRERFRLQNNPMLAMNNSRIEKAIRVIQLLLAHGTDVSTKISCLRATTTDKYWAPRNTAEEFAHSDNIKDMLRYALLQAEVHRSNMVESFSMGYHKRLGGDSQVNKLPAAIMQMVMDRV